MDVRRRQFLGMAAGLAGAAGLSATACGGRDGESTEETVLKLVAAEYGDSSDSGDSQRYWNELAADFRRQHPNIRVDVTVLSWGEIGDAVAAMVADGNPPDIAQLGSFADFAFAGELYPAHELLTIPVQADFIPSLAAAGRVRHVQYGLPFAASTRPFFYNKDLFRNAGLDPERPPRDWHELRQTAIALRASGVAVPFGLPLGPAEAQAESLIWMLSGGGTLADSSGSYTINSRENIETFSWLRDELVGEGLTGEGDPAVTNREEVFDGFANGQVAMLNGHPTLMRQTDQGKIDFGTAPLPGKSGPSDATLGVADWIMGFDQRGKREQIGQFLNFVFAAENVRTFADRYEMVPVTTPASQSMAESPEHERLAPFLDLMESAVFYPVGKESWARVCSEIKQGIGATVRPESDIPGILLALQMAAEDADRH